MAATTSERTTQSKTDTTKNPFADSPMMRRLLEALRKHEDVGHYGRLTFIMVARHFMDQDTIIDLIAHQPDQSPEKARVQVHQVVQRDYNPPKRERILEWQSQQDFQMIPDADNPDSGNIYRELQFPDHVYDEINHYYEEKE